MLDAVRVYLLAGGAGNLFSAIRLTNLLLVSVVSGASGGGLAGGLDTSTLGTGDSVTGADDRQSILNLATLVSLYRHAHAKLLCLSIVG